MTARDVFLCHADEDKRVYARPLTDALSKLGVSTWVDEAEIDPGESVLEAVNSGLRLSRFVVVLITEAFIARQWTRRELNAALTRELLEGETIVLPVLAIPIDALSANLPMLSDKLSLRWDSGLETTASRIASRFARRVASNWAYEHPLKYRGPVWVRCTPNNDTGDTALELTLRWGPYIRPVSLSLTNGWPISLVHHKIEADQATIHVQCSSPCIVTFGHGPPPDTGPRCVDINQGWTRVPGMDIGAPGFPTDSPIAKNRNILADFLDP